MKSTVFAAALAGSLLSTGLARAEEPGPNQVGAELLFGQVDLINDHTLIGISLEGQFALSDHAGFFGKLPIAHVSNDANSATSLGNATLGVNYLLQSFGRARSWLDASLSLPTAADDGEAAIAAGLFGLFWIPDPGLYFSDVTTVRGNYNYRFIQPGGNSLTLAGGFQYLAVEDGSDHLRVPLLIGANVQLAPTADFVGRFTTVFDLDAEDDEDDFLHTLELGVALFGSRSSKAEILFYLPMDESYRDDLDAWGIRGGFTTYL